MLNEKVEWKKLEKHREEMGAVHMRNLFAADKKRFEKFSLRNENIFLDYSSNCATDETLALLLDLARAQNIEGWRRRMFEGEHINNSESRSVLHTALRRPVMDEIIVEGENIMPFIHDVLTRMKKFSARIRSEKRVKTVVNIGIGGSDLGPRMVCAALGPASLDVRFVSNVDGAHLAQTLSDLKPAETLFLVASKTFTTQETMANAQAAREWIGDLRVADHFAALSTNEQAVTAFGIRPENMFPFRDWVGGRYSLWSSIGLSICLAHGFDKFRALLDGAYAMDRHFQDAPLEKNIPVVMALLGLWYRNFWEAQSYAVLPYAQNLHELPAWLQQLDMESNGKGVDRDGRPLTYDTGPVVFGIPGTDCQHSFCQLIHQGTVLIPCDFIGVLEAPADPGQHKLLLANMAAQSAALMQGRDHENPARIFEGNRPSNTILLDRLDAFSLGQLLALYEHKVFVQGILWNINSFDQWGVELGKTLTGEIMNNFKAGTATGLSGYIHKNAKF